MRRFFGTATLLLTLLLAPGLRAEEGTPPPRFANGRPIPGKVLKAKAEGLEIDTPRGPTTVKWPKLSAGTRYRYEPGYKENILAKKK